MGPKTLPTIWATDMKRVTKYKISVINRTHPRTIPARFGLIWFCGFRGKDLKLIFYQNMPNLHNRNKSAERKISQKSPEYMLNYSLQCSCS